MAVRPTRFTTAGVASGDVDGWISIDPNEQPQPGYDEYVRRKIAQGLADVEAGRVTSLADVRKEFGLE